MNDQEKIKPSTAAGEGFSSETKKNAVIERLRRELKELINNSTFVIDLEKFKQTEEGKGETADIMVQAGENIDEVREFLTRAEPDFTVIREGSGKVLDEKDTAFYLKINE